MSTSRKRTSPVAPQGLLLATQEAADFLGVSRPTLVKLLEAGAIAFEKPNRRRRVRLQDLIDFQQRRRAERRTALNQLTEEAGGLGFYDGTSADYATAPAVGSSAPSPTRRERVTTWLATRPFSTRASIMIARSNSTCRSSWSRWAPPGSR